VSEKIYAWLLKLYPAHFREEYGASASQLFRDRLRAECGVFRRLWFWLDMIADLAISIPREHWRRKPSEPARAGSLRMAEEAVAAMTKRGGVVPAVFITLFVALGLMLGWLGNSKIRSPFRCAHPSGDCRDCALCTNREGRKTLGGATN
jgi:hypothetical protein